MIFVFSYQREQMLNQVLKELKGEVVTILDDGSDFIINHPNVIRFKHGGKAKFWEKWFFAFKLAEGTDDDFFMFMPSDYSEINLDKIKEIHNNYKDKPYVYNIVNDGREMCWNNIRPIIKDRDTIQLFFTDCGFFCNRLALEAIEFQMKEIDKNRFIKRKDISSGVGQYLTYAFNRARVKMYKPKSSLAFHGDHESTMHPEHRKELPLISL